MTQFRVGWGDFKAELESSYSSHVIGSMFLNPNSSS